MSLQRFEVERFRVVSSKPFEKVFAALEAAVGHPDLAQFRRQMEQAHTEQEMVEAVRQAVGSSGLMEFARYDLGAVVQKSASHAAPRSIRLVVGNPLIMRQMLRQVPDAGSYAPVTILVDERAGGVQLSYDRMRSYLAPYANKEASQVATDLDAKVESLLLVAAQS